MPSYYYRVFHKMFYTPRTSSHSLLPSGLSDGGSSSAAIHTPSTSSSLKEGRSASRDATSSTAEESLIHHQSSRQLSAADNQASSSGYSPEPTATGSQSSQSHYSSATSRLFKRKSRRLKDSTKEMKLKLFLKRSSEPILDGVPGSASVLPATGLGHLNMIVEEFEPDVFRQLIEYIHTGCVTLQARTLLGLMNAADYYGLEELRKGCINFVSACITVDTVCALLASAERYIQYKCTKSLVQRVLEFVDHHGNDVLQLGSFAMLPEHVVRLILSREELKADELTKFQAVYHWSQRYCEASPASCDLRDIMNNFYECIEFYKIPATVLMREVHPLGVVPDSVVMNALAFQVCHVEYVMIFPAVYAPT